MGTNKTYSEFMEKSSKRTYSLSEAIDLQKFVDKTFGTNHTISWINAKTKNPVAIGYN